MDKPQKKKPGLPARLTPMQMKFAELLVYFEGRKYAYECALEAGYSGGNTETEMLEKKDRVDDALHATKAAIEEGIVPGGGAALLYASSGLKADSTGARIVIEACAKPFNQILVNAGYDNVKGQILADSLVNSGNDHWAGYNIEKEEVTNMKEAGIIDPTKVTRLALENAASVAGTVLLTECTITQDKDGDGTNAANRAGGTGGLENQNMAGLM